MEEVQDTEDQMQDVQTLFNEAIEGDLRADNWNKHAKKENLKEAQEEQEVSEEEAEEESIDHPHIMKVIYRRLSRKCHPDVAQWPSEAALFTELAAAYREQNYLVMLMIAEDLEVNIQDLKKQISKKHFKYFNKTLKELEGKISNYHGSFAWMWYHEEDEKRKKAIKELFLQTIDNMRKEE
tara:strand:- start:1892 stop:2434 length:543 start_codon:yes stop_codon:yes gene_type:complete